MAWVAADYIGEWIFNYKPDMWAGDCIEHNYWLPQDRHGAYGFQLPKGSIRKLIGKELSWKDDPVELKKMKKVTCICDATIKGVKFIKGCNYEVDDNPFIGIMIYYTPFNYINISKWQLDYYFI